MPYCQTCGSPIDEYDSGYYARSMLCIPCYGRKSSEVESISCSRCGTRVRKYEAKEKEGRYLCNYCFGEISRVEHLPHCAICKEMIESWEKREEMPGGKIVHSACLRDKREETKKIIRDEEKWSEQDLRKGGGGTILGAVMNKIVSILP